MFVKIFILTDVACKSTTSKRIFIFFFLPVKITKTLQVLSFQDRKKKQTREEPSKIGL